MFEKEDIPAIDPNTAPILEPIMDELTGQPLPPDPQLVNTAADTATTTATATVPETATVIEPEIMPENDAAIDMIDGDTAQSPGGTLPLSNLTASGLIPIERNRLRASLEEQHRRTKDAHDRIIKAMADRAAFMESVATQVEAQNAELSDYHKNFGS